MTLTDEDRAVLDFAGKRFRYAGARAEAIRDTFGWTDTRYHQRLGQLIDMPEALAYAPMTVNRLRRMTQRRRSA